MYMKKWIMICACVAVFQTALAQHIRLFFNWNKTKTLEQNLEILNAFDRIQIEYVEGILIVK